ncbi:MAG: endolytic transglycosylase MltG [Gammaproteobacteria bacterium]
MIARLFLWFTALVFVLAASVAVWLYRDFSHFTQQVLTLPEEGEILHVKKGMTLRAVANTLAEKGITQHPHYLIWLGRKLKQDSGIKTGEFQLQPGLTPIDLLATLNKGTVIQHGITIIEGQTFKNVLASLINNPKIESTLDGLSTEEVMTALGYADQKPEGRFLADTYYYTKGTPDRDLLKRAYQSTEQYLEKVWPERAADLPLESPYEALILASIIEKETAIADERPRIAGVFVRRLVKGMRLETDPTVIYGMGEDYKGDIRYKDLRTDTPFNTYTRKGLPPTPIASTGKAAIDAALHPAEEDVLFFVAEGGGRHYFSKTYAEHKKAVKRYLNRNK